MRRKEVKPSELVEEAINRIENLNPQINAVIHKMYDPAKEAAKGDLPDGAFRGVPFLLKDLVAAYAGVPMRGGSRFYNDFVPDHDSELVKRYKAAGVCILGKTNTPEYGLMPVTEPELFGPSNNPWNLTRTTGGSSGGSAAAVAAGMVPLAHGNDGGGSIRIPASCCGLFGLKPTRGRNPLGPDFGEVWQGMACDHVLTRSVRDSAAMLDATAGPDIGALYYATPPSRPFLDEVGENPGKLRIAFTSKPFLPGVVHEDCIKSLEATVKLCQDLGHELVEAAPKIDGKDFARAFLTMVCGETRANIEEAEAFFGRKATFSDFEPSTWAVGLLGKQCTAAKFSRAIRLLQNSARQVGQFFENYDVLLTPTLAMPPVMTGALQPKGTEVLAMKILGRLNAGALINALAGIDALADKVFEFVPYTSVFNATGQPAMSVPLYWNDEGLPIGMHFVGRYGDEATLFRLAGQLEQAKPWFDRTPPICG
ncbi:MAG: amidase [Candidatus Desulfatibia sp.]|uniref:amidase n=1 Tax=Candidatus Desulfatibia sp. TaxID=3101189 RepID=UPI002F2F4C49